MRDPGFPYTEEREGMARLCIPIEDFENGLYIHPGSATLVAVTSTLSHRDSEIMGDPDGIGPSTGVYVLALDFMEVQRERDELKRTLSRINAIRATKGEFAEKWERACDLLQVAGFDGKQAEAMAGLIDWATKGVDGG